LNLIWLHEPWGLTVMGCLVCCCVGAITCLWGDARGHQLTLGLGKMSASLAFLALGLLSPQASQPTHAIFFGGRELLLGTHLLYAWAALSELKALSLSEGFSSYPLALSLGLGALAVGALVLKLLAQHIPQPLKAPSVVYMVAISVMVGLCGALSVHLATELNSTRGVLFGLGALAFWLSDLSVARERFMDTGFSDRRWGIPLYFLAQLAFALTLYPLE
jgi:hypothetical protein